MTNIKNIVSCVSKSVQMAGKRPFRVSIEGNIGSGKSTCIKFFEKFNHVQTHAVSKCPFCISKKYLFPHQEEY